MRQAVKLTKQEMFDRAYRGLASQKWKQCTDGETGACLYNGQDNTHCAWGHVDPDIPKNKEGVDLVSLSRMRSGVARTLDDESFDFAFCMQNAHDANDQPSEMRAAFVALAKEHGLKIPRLSK